METTIKVRNMAKQGERPCHNMNLGERPRNPANPGYSPGSSDLSRSGKHLVREHKIDALFGAMDLDFELPSGRPNLVREDAILGMSSNEFKRILCRRRNALARERYSEKFQDGINTIFATQMKDLKTFLVSRFDDKVTMFTAHKIEALLSTIVLLRKTDDTMGRLAAITLCLNSFLGNAVSHRVYSFLQKNYTDFVTEERYQASDLRDILDNWDRLNDSSFIEKIRNVASYCMAFSVLESMGLPEAAAEIIYAEFKVQKRSKQITSFIHAILDAIEFTCSRAIVCVREGSLNPLLHTTSTYTEWYDNTMKLEKWTSMLTCDSETLEFSFQEYEAELIDCIKLGHNFVKHAKSNSDRKMLTVIVNRLELFLADYQTKHIVGKSRLMPFGLLVYGDSSVGKSSFTDILFSFTAKVLGQKDEPEYKYTRNFRDPFWSGFKSFMWFILLDDVGSIAPNKVQGTDPSVDEIISIMNTVGLLCNMADLSEKGRVAVRPLVVVATTNHPWMNVQHYAYHPSAMMRRFPYRITIKVNEKYRMPDAPTMLDPTKCNVDYSTSYPDFWDLTIDRVLASPLPTDGSKPTVEPILIREHTDIGMADFLPWLRKKLLAHMESQKDIQVKMKSMSQVDMCEHHVPVGNCRECTQLQVGLRGLVSYTPQLNWKEKILGFLLYLYFWLYVGMSRERAEINAYRRAVPALRIANSASRTLDWVSTLNPFRGVTNLTLQAPQLPTRTAVADVATHFYETAMANKKFIAVSATIGVAAALIKFLRTAEALQFSFMRPSPQNEKKAARWTNDSVHLSPLTLSRQTKSMKGLSDTQVLDIVSKNVIGITLYTGRNTAFDNVMLALGGNIYLMNKHILDKCEDEFRMDCIMMPSAKAGTRNASIKFSKSNVKKVIDDIALVEINNFPPAARVDHLLPTRGFDVHAHGSYIKRGCDGLIEIKEARNIAKGTLQLLNVEGYWSDCASRGGDCGSPLIAFTSYGPVLLGIHTAGKVAQDRAFCSRLFKEDIEEFILIDSGVVSLQCDAKKIDLYPMINRSDPILFLEESNCAVYGTLSTGTSKLKSNVRETSVAPFFKSKGWSTTHVQPTLGTWKPWYHSMKDMAQPNLQISSSEANWLATKTMSQYFAQLPQSERSLIQLYDIDTAVSGAPGVNYVNSLAMKTSLGFPWRKPKREKINFDPETGVFYLDDELIRRVHLMIETYRQGERCNPIFCGSEKDEARAAEKNALGKIRIFMGAPTDFVVVMRMFFGSLIRVVQRNPSAFECAVGINAHSKEWHDLATDLLVFGDDCHIDGDYQAYDKKMESVLIYCCIVAAGDEIVANLADTCGFSHDELKRIYRAIAADVAFAYVDFNGTLVAFLRNHVSGEPLTVIINCFVGGCYVRYAYWKATNDDPELSRFLERVVLRTYGDDNILAIRPDFLETFNFSVIQQKLSQIGVTYTRADKKEGDYISKSLGEIDFLKRSFVYSTDLGRYTGPLAISSIQKSFLIGVCSKSITQEERDLATMNSGLREFFFHGREVYEENRALILECCSQNGMKFNPKNFPPYDHYLEMYKENDIVHFEYFELEEDSSGHEELQIGEIYVRSGGEHQYTPKWIDGDFIISCTPFGDFEVTHVALVPHQHLALIIDQVRPYTLPRGYLTSARLKRFRSKISQNYRHALCRKISAKLTEVVNEDIQWRYLEARIDNAVSLGGQTNPSAHSINRVFSANIYEPSSGERAVATYYNGGGADDFTSDASSGNAEHCVRQNDEAFQSSEEVILSFADEAKGEVGQIGTGTDRTRQTSVYKDAGISQFLSRPVLISTSTWQENGNTNIFVDPFYAFFNDSRIKNKITNYSLLRCNLKVKVMINASPFYYGIAKAVWKPLPDYAPDTFTEVVGQPGWRVPYSQIPGFYIHVETNEGGEMSLPFFYHKNWLRITSATETRNMGQLQIRSLTPLYNANSVSGADVTIQVYAWAENVELSGPTIAEALQSGDEYTSPGPISGPASAIANAAGALSKIPIIKPYALATQMISSKVADVARYFGFTNVANLASEAPVHPGAFLGMASTNLMTPFESLTIDDKNELSIDPRIAGIQPKDELLISEFCGRESWIWQSTWSSSNAVNTILFQSRVLPELIRTENSTVYRQSTPMAHINRMFGNWRGPIRFRFKFICSKYHRGRVRITYDPEGDLYSNAVTSTTSITRIVDIAEESNVEIEVPYMQALSFLKTAAGVYSFIENMNGGGSALVRQDQYDNGQISVRVFTQQTSPVADAPIIMQVYVSAPDIEFAAPIEVPKDFSIETLQSSEERDVVTTNVDNNDENIYSVHFGERITSLRQLLRRKNFYYAAQLGQGVDGNDSAMTVNKLTLPRLPVPYGYAPNGGFQSPGILVPGSQYPANYIANTPLSLLMQCFVGVTGSMVYTINVDSPYQAGSVYVSRALESYTPSTTAFKPQASDVYIASGHGTLSKKMYFGMPCGAAGRVLTNQYTQAGLTVKIPMYSNRRFLATSAYNVQSATKVDGSELDTFTTVVLTKPNVHAGIEKSTQAQFYYMAGADFNLLYFRNVPTYYVYNLPWTTT